MLDPFGNYFEFIEMKELIAGALGPVQREGADLKGAMWSLRGNTWNLSEDRQEQRKNLCRQYTKLGLR